MRMRHHTEKMAAAFGRDQDIAVGRRIQDISVGRGIRHQHNLPTLSRLMPISDGRCSNTEPQAAWGGCWGSATNQRFVSSAGRMAWQCGQATTRPRRGRVDVKFTWSRSSLTAFSVDTVCPQWGHLTGVSSRYTASNLSGCPIPESFRLIQTVALLGVTPLSESAATLTRVRMAVSMAEEMNGGR